MHILQFHPTSWKGIIKGVQALQQDQRAMSGAASEAVLASEIEAIAEVVLEATLATVSKAIVAAVSIVSHVQSCVYCKPYQSCIGDSARSCVRSSSTSSVERGGGS